MTMLHKRKFFYIYIDVACEGKISNLESDLVVIFLLWVEQHCVEIHFKATWISMCNHYLPLRELVHFEAFNN